MHELSVCQALLRQVTELATANGASAATHIEVAVGPLSGVEPALLERAFWFAREGSCAAHATLSFTPVPVRVRCLDCSAESACDINRLICAQCSSYRTRVVSGDALHLMRVELSTARPPESTPYGLSA